MKGNRALTDDEVDKCLNSFDGRFKLRNQALFILGLNTGFRISELLSITVKQVKPYNEITDYLTIERKYIKKQTQGQTVFLNDITKKYLKNFIDNWEEIYGFPIQPEYFLFKSQVGQNKSICSKQG